MAIDGSSSAPLSFRSHRKLQLAVAAAGIVVLSLGAGLLGSRLEPSPQPFATSVVPASGGQPNTTGAGAGSAPAASLGQGTALSSAGAAPTSAYYGGACSQAPTVQIQGRGVTATGFASVNGAGAAGSLVTLYVQGQGGDASAAASAAESKTAAVQAALAKIGLTPDQVQQTGFNVYSGPPNQATATAYLQAHVAPSGDVAKVITAAIQAGASSAYSGTPLPPDDATDADVRDAVTRAATQAKTMAVATASAVGDQIAQLQSIVTQPPQLCYGPAGSQRVVGVTVSYSLK